MKRISGWLALPAAFGFAVFTAACDDTARGVQQDSAEIADEAREEADEVDVDRTANDVGGELDAAGETMDVKAALLADTSVDGTDINVDTYHETRTVVLKGSVDSEAEKTAAGRIAQREAPGYRIDNQLTVRPER